MNCANCGTEARTTQQEGNFLDGGLSFDLVSLGFYGGFWDNFSQGKEGLAHICHDCSLLFMRALPGLAKRILPQGGGHPNNIHVPVTNEDREVLEPSCCEFAWTWNAKEQDADGQHQTYFGTPDGDWEKVVRVENKLLRVSCVTEENVV